MKLTKRSMLYNREYNVLSVLLNNECSSFLPNISLRTASWLGCEWDFVISVVHNQVADST